MTDDVDFDALRPTARAKATAGMALAGAFVTLLLANQSNTIIRFEGVFALVIVGQFALGLSLGLCGFFVFRMRSWAVLGAMVVGAFAAATSAGWLVFTFMNGVISLMPLLVVPVTGFAGFLAYTARPDVEKAESARQRMEDSGMDLGM